MVELNSWNEFTGKKWLKAEDVKDENHIFVCTKVDTNETNQLVLSLESEGNNYLFGLNVTNAQKCKDFVTMPKDLVGKKIKFKKVLTRDPNKQIEVEGIRISNIE